MDGLKRLVNSKNSVRYCQNCGIKMQYAAVLGTYTCKQCGAVQKDTYGLMKDLLEDNPNLSMSEVSLILGVPLREVRSYVRSDGVLENPRSDQAG